MALTKKLALLIVLLFYIENCVSQNDCSNAIVSCGNTNFHNLSLAGEGIQEVTGFNSCGSGETNSLWIKVTIKTAGTLGFLITPENPSGNVDFDFYVFGPGPDVTCETLGYAIRCSTTHPLAAGTPNNLTGMNASEIDQHEGPSENGNNYVQWLDVSEDETYYIAIDRPGGDGNFSREWTGTATFSDPPLVNGAGTGLLNLQLCDSDADADESTEFDLTQIGAVAIAAQGNLIASYHLSEGDAVVGANAIANPGNFRNTSNPQTLFLRLQNAITGCASLASFELHVTAFNFPALPDLEECDQDNDGFAVFNLSSIRELLDAPGNSVSFHHSTTDVVALPDLYSNQTAFTGELLWAKIHNADKGCTAFLPFHIIIKPIPAVLPAQLAQCDFGLFPDGITTFDLTQAHDSLTNGDSALSTAFFLNDGDALNNQNPLPAVFNNSTNPQVLTAMVTNGDSGCYSLTTLTLTTNINPTTTVTLQQCDDAGQDGMALFNLADAGFETAGTTVQYFNTLTEALLEQNPITTQQFSEQDVYVRIENGNDCIGIHIIELVVPPLPQVVIETDGVLCANIANQPAILQAVVNNPGNHQLIWSHNGATTLSTAIFQPGEYTVTVTDTQTHCAQTASVQVAVSEAPVVQSMAVADLVQVNSVTALVSGNGDYWYSLDESPYQQSNFFEPVAPGIHTLSIRDDNGCGSVLQTVYVLGVPPYFTPNGDGYHDYWAIKGLDLRTNGDTKISIFNRYGKLLWQSGPMVPWDGLYNDRPMPADDYWYLIEFADGRLAKGHFALKR